MAPADNIRLLKRNEINDNKWNSCVSNSANGFLYSYSWYLDCFADKWFGIVSNDYEAVMAIPFKKKLGIPYVYLPSLIPHLGLIGEPVTEKLLRSF
jgi:hypothetical protein